MNKLIFIVIKKNVRFISTFKSDKEGSQYKKGQG